MNASEYAVIKKEFGLTDDEMNSLIIRAERAEEAARFDGADETHYVRFIDRVRYTRSRTLARFDGS